MKNINILLILICSILLQFVLSASDKGVPLVVSTWARSDFLAANKRAWGALVDERLGRLTALITGLSECERLRCDGTVGWGGSPDEHGETTLDSLLIDGPTHSVGAVAALRRIRDAARVAAAVMNHTEHTLLVGEKATHFALSMGFREEPLTSKESKQLYQKWISANCQPNFWKNVEPDPKSSCGPYRAIEKKNMNKYISYHRSQINEFNHDTLGMIVIDENGDIAAGTSSNGANHKIPGRVGDSPIPGSGAYVDNDVGGAVATGDGDIMMRFSPSFLAVELMRHGSTASEAATEAIGRIKKYHPHFFGAIVVAHRSGDYSAACSNMSSFPFSVSRANLDGIFRTSVAFVDCA